MDQVFPAAEREIFPYFNGVKEVKGDPLEIEARYLRELAGEDLGAIDKMLESPDVQTRLRGSDKMVPAIRAAFRLREFDEDTGEGLTLGEAFALFNRFIAWKHDLKAGSAPGPSTPQSSDDGPAPG